MPVINFKLTMLNNNLQSPPWHMNWGITRWKDDPLKPKPFSPVQRARKFSAVFGTTSDRNSIVTRPIGSLPPMDISKYTFGNFFESDAICLSIEIPVIPRLLGAFLQLKALKHKLFDKNVAIFDNKCNFFILK